MKSWQLMKVFGTSLLVAAAGACVGGIDPGTGTPGGGDSDTGGSSSLELFTATLQKQVQECGACHSGTNLNDTATGPDYLGPVGASPEVAMETVLAYQSWQPGGGPIVGSTPENSKLFFYGLHTGAAASPALADALRAWIVQEELENPKGGTPDPGDEDEPDVGEPVSLVEALEQFGNCMKLADFEASNMENVADQNSAEGQCSGCHSQGLGGAYLSANNQDFYENLREMPYVLKFVTGTVNADGSFRDLVMSRRFELKKDDNGHPNYILAADRIASVEQYYQLTYQHYRTAIDTNTPCVPEVPVQQ